MNDKNAEYIRPAAVAGSFYPGSPSELAKMIAQQFHDAPKPRMSEKPMAIISPHAGYVYSGAVAAKAYKALEGLSYNTVIVISPSHSIAFRGSHVFAGKAYTTPFGEIPVDKDLSQKIASNEGVELSNIGHLTDNSRPEHSLEVQLPFLQTVLGKFNLVAIMMGEQDFNSCKILGESIADAIDKRGDVLIVASSDLSHFHDSNTARALDSRIREHIADYDYKGLLNDLSRGKAEACGGGPMAAAMIAAEIMGANDSYVAEYAHSGDVTGDNSSVVGYLSAVIFKSKAEKVYDLDASDDETEEIEIDNFPPGSDFELSPEDKKMLLRIARESIKSKLEKYDFEYPDNISSILKEKRGAFVTLEKKGNLRGCIGTFQADKPLYNIVFDMAREAAFSDPRFPAVSNMELSLLDIEISVLTPMMRIDDPENVRVGRDGLYIINGYNRGVLLPQVAVEYDWDKYEFLAQTCHKAGLPPDAWKDKNSEIYIFQALIFGEE